MAGRITDRAGLIPALGECFREYGYEGASLARIGEATGLGKGSLYHFFPGGKEEMAAAVLADIGGWFDAHIFAPLRSTQEPEAALAAMFDAVEDYFRSGRRVCLVGAFAVSDTRDRFADAVKRYFTRWIAALETALTRSGRSKADAKALAEEIVATIQGAIVLTRALDDPTHFSRAIKRLKMQVARA